MHTFMDAEQQTIQPPHGVDCEKRVVVKTDWPRQQGTAKQSGTKPVAARSGAVVKRADYRAAMSCKLVSHVADHMYRPVAAASPPSSTIPKLSRVYVLTVGDEHTYVRCAGKVANQRICAVLGAMQWCVAMAALAQHFVSIAVRARLHAHLHIARYRRCMAKRCTVRSLTTPM